ncbi:MAG: TolC family protein, partial [Xanthobacteraceae bacterium]
MSEKGVRAHRRTVASLLLAAAAIGAACSGAAADTLEWALVQAYQNNPSLNAQRASLRATDENVPQALSGYRPKVSVTANAGINYTNATSVVPLGGILTNSQFAQTFASRGVSAQATQTLFNGFQNANRTRQAESQVMGARE